jgi:hypothetical protein
MAKQGWSDPVLKFVNSFLTDRKVRVRLGKATTQCYTVACGTPPYILNRQLNNAPRRRDPSVLQENIVTGKRRRQAHLIEAAPALSKYFAFAASVAQAKEAVSVASQPRIKPDPTRIYRDDLPPPPLQNLTVKVSPYSVPLGQLD